jgi:hypothetical protein
MFFSVWELSESRIRVPETSREKLKHLPKHRKPIALLASFVNCYDQIFEDLDQLYPMVALTSTEKYDELVDRERFCRFWCDSDFVHLEDPDEISPFRMYEGETSNDDTYFRNILAKDSKKPNMAAVGHFEKALEATGLVFRHLLWSEMAADVMCIMFEIVDEEKFLARPDGHFVSKGKRIRFCTASGALRQLRQAST